MWQGPTRESVLPWPLPPAPQKEKEDGAEDKDSRVVVLCLATDGRFVYLNTTGGFMKVGTGYHRQPLLWEVRLLGAWRHVPVIE